jgi:Tol biopolymer transport system component
VNLRNLLLCLSAAITLGCRARVPARTSTIPLRTSTIPRFRGELDSADARFTKGLHYDPVDVALAWTRAGTIIVAHYEHYSLADVFSGTCAGSGIFAVPAGGGPVSPLVVGRPVCEAFPRQYGVAVDPSANWLVYSVSIPPNNSALVKLSLRTKTVHVLSTGCRAYLQNPSVSPDGRFISAIGICRSREQPDWATYILRSDGSELRGLALDVPIDQSAPGWSPDGTRLIVAGSAQLLIVDTAGSKRQIPLMVDTAGTQRRLPKSATFLAWSPDGEWLAYGSGPTIQLVRPTGTEPHEVFRNREQGTYRRGWADVPEGMVAGPIVWSPDSKSLVFSRVFDNGISIWRLDLEHARLSQLTVPDHDQTAGRAHVISNPK